MKQVSFFSKSVIGVLASLIPIVVSATTVTVVEKKTNEVLAVKTIGTVNNILLNTNLIVRLDSIKVEKTDKTKEKDQEKANTKPEPKKPEIKKVPKARNQERPKVIKPNIKIKPVKIIRPKIRKP
ncbi:MAG TPA: hypothetical protein VF273_08045 [Pelobium sp.]